MPSCRRRRFGALAIQECSHERDQRLPHRLPVAHHLVSGASVLQRRLRPMAGRHPVCGVQRGNRAHDDPVRASIARPRHQPRIHLRLLRRHRIRAARCRVPCRNVCRTDTRHRHATRCRGRAGGGLFARSHVLHRARRLQASIGRKPGGGYRACSRCPPANRQHQRAPNRPR